MTYANVCFDMMGDPTRREIVSRLAAHPSSVGELASGLPVSRPAVSQHLKVLKDVGLVIDRQEGTRRLYQVDPEGLAALRAHLDRVWARSLAAYQTRIEDEKGGHDDSDR